MSIIDVIIAEFKWVGSLFVHKAEEGAQQVVRDEINKKHDEITAAVTPLLQTVPEEHRDQTIANVVEIAKNVGVAAAEAAIDSKTQIPGAPAQ